MTTTMEISVTQENADKGSTHRCNACPIALAIARELEIDLPASRFVLEVQPTHITAVGHALVIDCPTPPEVAKRISAWDATGKLEPFKFTVPVKPRGSKMRKHWIHDLFSRAMGMQPA